MGTRIQQNRNDVHPHLQAGGRHTSPKKLQSKHLYSYSLNMPFVISNKQRIHYKLAGERGPWMILHPPFIVSFDAWHHAGFVESLEKDFRLILIDPLGQGRSGRPLDAVHYRMESRVDHVLEVMKEVQLDFAHFLGMGLGGKVGFQMAVLHPQKIRSLITADAHPYPIIDELQSLEEGIAQLSSGNMGNYLQQWRSEDHLSFEQQQQILEGNPQAYSISMKAACEWEGVGNQLTTLNRPALLFTATSEPRFLSVREAGRRLRYGRYVILPKIQRSHGLLTAELILQPMLEFVLRQRY